MFKLIFFPLILLINITLNGQAILVGGPCEGCEAVFEYGDKILLPVDTLPDFNNPRTKIKVTGTIYENDAKTPAANVILYIYHTNPKGIYETLGNEEGWGKRHGYIRGWIKTDSSGKYTFYTLKPGTYPNRSEPAHIHGTILEPGKYYYWIDSWQFKNDPLLKVDIEKEEKASGGSGIVELKQGENTLVVKRDIILGKNIPGYK
jgi:protocatechuate 3,4-dioxygenase, beta subunit